MSFEIVKLARLRRPVRNPGIGITALIIMSILLAGLAGCASPATATKPTVVIGYMDNGAEPELIAIALGLFSKRMNANVQIKYFDSGPASLGAIASGALQIMSGIGSPPIVSAITRGVSLQVVWSQELYTSAEGLVVRSDAGIHSVKDLQGKTIALVLGSTSEFALDATLKKAGVNPSTVHKLNMSPPAMRTAWSNHSIDAAYVWDPVFDTISHENGKILSTDQNVQQEAPVYSLSLVNIACPLSIRIGLRAIPSWSKGSSRPRTMLSPIINSTRMKHSSLSQSKTGSQSIWQRLKWLATRSSMRRTSSVRKALDKETAYPLPWSHSRSSYRLRSCIA